jgi:hypothetical protein
MLAILFPVIISTLSFAQTPPDSTDPALAKAAIEKIWSAANQFHNDHGDWPKTPQELIEKRYLELDSVTLAQWKFSIALGYPYSIHAASVDSVWAGKHGRVSGYADKYHLDYDVIKGIWRGHGQRYYGSDSLSVEERADLIKRVKTSTEMIWFWTEIFYKDRGIWPQTVVELERMKYTQLDPGVIAQWTFALIGSPPEKIIAISTDVMPAGAGHALEYDVKSETWKGFGIP